MFVREKSSRRIVVVVAAAAAAAEARPEMSENVIVKLAVEIERERKRCSRRSPPLFLYFTIIYD